MRLGELSLSDSSEFEIVLEVSLGCFEGKEEKVETEHAHDTQHLAEVKGGHCEKVC